MFTLPVFLLLKVVWFGKGWSWVNNFHGIRIFVGNFSSDVKWKFLKFCFSGKIKISRKTEKFKQMNNIFLRKNIITFISDSSNRGNFLHNFLRLFVVGRTEYLMHESLLEEVRNRDEKLSASHSILSDCLYLSVCFVGMHSYALLLAFISKLKVKKD